MFRVQLHSALRLLVVALVLSVCALAQTYPGGGGGGGGMGGTYSPGSHSYGHGAAIGAAVGGAAGATALYFGLRHHRQVVGCVTPDGKNLKTDDGKHTYQLAGTEQVSAGEHVTVVGKKTKGDSGIDQLEIRSVKKHMGQCEQNAALIEQIP